jgi:hypothetical protein
MTLAEGTFTFRARFRYRTMKEDLESAARYRQHAEELRRIADLMPDDAKQALRGIAAQYDHLASVRELIDERERKH